MPTLRAACALLVASVLPAGPAAGITVDGQLDPEYGTALVVQTTQTGLSSGGQIPGDNNLGDLVFASGSELDACHAVVSGGVLHLFLGGNLALRLNQNQNGTNGHVLDVFFDSAPGGQNTLNGLGTGHPLNGFTFDAGFEADFLLEFRGDGNQFSVEWWATRAVFPSGSGGTFTNLGYSVAGGPGTLVGGTNPHGILVTIDNANTAGVTQGCLASSGAGVTRGVEWQVPLSAIGNPEGCFRVAVIVRDGSSSTSQVSNQMLAPAPPGTCPPGPAASVSLDAIAGDQFVEVCPSATGVPLSGVAGFELAVAGSQPLRADRVGLAFRLPDSRPATLRLYDCAGRIVRDRVVSGAGIADLADGTRLAPGLYWARLSRGAASVTRKLCVVR